MLVNKEITSVELTEDVLARIDEVEGDVKAYLTITRDEALAQAKAVDEKIAKGEKISFLEGIPGAIKDNICTKGVKTTCASKILENFVPPYDATVMTKLKAENPVILGKLNSYGKFCVPSDLQPLEYGMCTGRFFGRQCSIRSCWYGDLVAWLGYGRFHPSAGLLLRRGRLEADLRPCFPLWPRGLWFFFGPDWPCDP